MWTKKEEEELKLTVATYKYFRETLKIEREERKQEAKKNVA